jgi:hypothetical protein
VLRVHARLTVAALACLATACGSVVAMDATARSTDSGPPDVTIEDAGVNVGEAIDSAVAEAAAPCVPGATQCTNCVDDDGDGLIDALDPECTGPRDNDERTFGLGIPADDICFMGCAFDGIVGREDPCSLDAKCIFGSADPKCPYDYAAAADPARCPTPSEACIAHCRPMTPLDCDCFGCCLVHKESRSYLIRLVDTCTSASLDDPTKCPSCRMTWRCANSTTGPCPPSYPPCDEKTPCPSGQYCLTGCCIKPG